MYYISNKGEAIREAKKFLYFLSLNGYPEIPRTTVDSFFDEETEAAVRVFQSIMNIPVTGEIDYITHTLLYEEYLFFLNDFETRDYVISADGFPFEIGMISEDVRTLHGMINELAAEYSLIESVGNSNYYSKRSADTVRALRKIFLLPPSESIDKDFYQRMIMEIDSIRRREVKYPEG